MEKRLLKSRSGKMLFGVCGGLARYLDIDSTIVRVVFVVFGILLWGILAYVLLALLMPPEAETAAPTPSPALPAPGANGSGHPPAAESQMPVEVVRPDSAKADFERRRAVAIGVLLAMVGVVAVLGGREWEVISKVWPVMLIGVGVLLIWTFTKRKPK